MKLMTPITERSIKKMGRLNAEKLEACCQRHKATKGKHVDIFDAYEDHIPQIAEVVKAEKNAQEIFDKIAAYDMELAYSMDMVIGSIARAYEKQGFNGGLAVASGVL